MASLQTQLLLNRHITSLQSTNQITPKFGRFRVSERREQNISGKGVRRIGSTDAAETPRRSSAGVRGSGAVKGGDGNPVEKSDGGGG